MIITSDRKFGVEIEFSCQSREHLRKVYSALPIVSDGSLNSVPFSAEYVSPVLCGRSGEKNIMHACEVLKKNTAHGDDPHMSVHIHLDGRNNDDTIISSSTPPTTVGSRVTAFSNKLVRLYTADTLNQLIKNPFLLQTQNVSTKTFNGIMYVSLGELQEAPTKFFTYYWKDEDSRFVWLRNVLYFYTLYSNVMENMVSNSRKFGNMYCIPLASSYDVGDIAKCTNMSELKLLWYKGRTDTNNHYDDSRYHSVNLHAFWNRHGTVEIRSHGGTIDANKILLWVKLHQKIVDKLETLTLDDLRTETTDQLASFIEFVEEPVLQAYVKRLLGFYSDITIK